MRGAALVALAAVALAQAPAAYRGPNRLGPYRINPPTRLGVLSRELGRGAGAGAEVGCYQNPEQHVYIVVEARTHDPGRAGSVQLNARVNCVGVRVNSTRARLQDWKSGEGIGLGSMEADVLRAYGKPEEEASVGSDSAGVVFGAGSGAGAGPGITYRVLIYGNGIEDLRFAKFGMYRGRASWIEIGNDE